jgi:hypothetical protein
MTAAPDLLTWDIPLADGGPRRPSLADVGGATVEDDAPAPDKSRMLYSDQVNQWAKQIEALGRVAVMCEISVEIIAGVPTIVGVTAPGTNVVVATFPAPTDNGIGDTTITWPAGTLPPPSGKPDASIDTDGAFLAPWAGNVTNGVRVKTRNAAGTLTDANFTVRLR